MLLIALLWCFVPRGPRPPQVGSVLESEQAPPHLKSPPWAPTNMDEEAKAALSLEFEEFMVDRASYWAAGKGRMELRRVAVAAARHGRLDMLDAYYSKGKVPINSIPTDEKVKPWETPLVAAVMAGKEDAALHLLSLAGSEQDLDLGRRLDRGNTVLHHAVRKGHTRLVDKLLLHGAPVHVVADNGRTPLSAAVEDYNFDMAGSLLEYYYVRGQSQEAFEKSFYDREQQQFIPLLHRVSSWNGQHTEAGMLCIAQFLIEQGADVSARNYAKQTPADVALSRCGFPLLYLIFPQCSAPLLYQYLQHAENGLDEEDEVFTTLYDRASSPLHGTAYFAWFLLAGVFFVMWWFFTGDERTRREKRATEEAARKLAFGEEHETRKKKQQGISDRKKTDRIMLLETKSKGGLKDKGALSMAITEGKRKANKKNKNKKHGRPAREQQDLAEAATVPGDIVEEEEAGAMTLQEPVQEQQLLAALAPPDEEEEDVTSAAEEAKGETSTPFSTLPDQGDNDGENEGEDEEEKMMPDEAFLLEGASSTLVCSISFKLMTSAVIAKDSHSYQKEALETWIERCKSKGLPLTSPLTSAPMEPQMMANQALRVLVGEHIEARERAWRQQLAEKKRNTGGEGH